MNVQYIEIDGLPEGLHERRVPNMPEPSPGPIRPGDYYEDCRFHPMLCVDDIDPEDPDQLLGISLVLGGGPGSCSRDHCGVRKLAVDEAIAIARTGVNWSKCYYCGHHQVVHRDLERGGCDEESGCDCNHAWSPAGTVGW